MGTSTYKPLWLNRRALLAGMTGSILLPALSLPSHAQDAKPGGTLKIGVGGSTTDTLDPALLVGGMEILIAMGQLRNCLVEINEKSEAIPELAESWASADGAKTWIFKIRSGVEFHDGKPLAVEDVLYSIKYHLGEQSKSAAKSLLSSVKSIEPHEKDSIIFQLTEGNADFPFLLSDYHLQIVPNGTTSGDFAKGVGTGGYILEKFIPGQQAVVRKNPGYWKAGRAHFDRIETISITDSTARANALMTGELDLIASPDLKTIDKLKQQPGVKIAASFGRAHPTLAMRVTEAPFDDNEVRLALKYAIDRDDIVAKVLKGYGEIGNDQPISSAYRFFSKPDVKHSYDPDRARMHMKRSKSPDAVIDLHASNAAFEGAVDMAVLFKEHAKKAGITINVVKEANDGYWDNVWMKTPFCVGNWFGRPTEDMMFSLAYGKGASWNETTWVDDKFDKLLLQARAETDDKVRKPLYVELQTMVAEEGGVIVPFFNADLIGYNEAIQHGDIASNAPLDGFRLPERWWKA